MPAAFLCSGFPRVQKNARINASLSSPYNTLTLQAASSSQPSKTMNDENADT